MGVKKGEMEAQMKLLEWYRFESRKRSLTYAKWMDELDRQFKEKSRVIERSFRD